MSDRHATTRTERRRFRLVARLAVGLVSLAALPSPAGAGDPPARRAFDIEAAAAVPSDESPEDVDAAFKKVGLPPPIPPPPAARLPGAEVTEVVAPADPPPAARVDDKVSQVECSSCGTRYLPELADGGCPSCGGSGMCTPGRKGCHPWHAHTYAGRLLGNLYECICCPDPCYQPGWVAEANAAFSPDFPRPQTLTRFRWDYGRNMVFPDRNEFFWPRSNVSADQWKMNNASSNPAYKNLIDNPKTKVVPGKKGKAVISHLPNGVSSYAGKGPKTGVVTLHTKKGVLRYQPWGERQLTFNELYFYTEAASASSTASAFFEYPYRSWTGLYDGHAAGLGDLRFGTKAVLLDCELLLLTFQFKTYMPTGNFLKGLGTGHVSLEPSLIAALRLGPETFVVGQLAEWIPMGGDPAYAGAMLNYHLAMNHVLHRFTPDVPLIGTFEFNGWSFQDGAYTNPFTGPTPSSHDTYFSVGPGLRLSICNRVDFGANVTVPLGGDHWASTWVRTELRLLY